MPDSGATSAILALAAPPAATLAAFSCLASTSAVSLSLRQLLARHASILVVDTCAPRVEAALWLDGAHAPAARACVEGEASAALPEAVARVLSNAAARNRRIADLDAVAFCDGPGSVLGIRLAAATLRAWRAVRTDLALYSYHSLPLLAVAYPGLTIIADARRDTWHAVTAGSPHALKRLPSAELAALAPLATPESFRRWSALPPGVEPLPLPWSATDLLAQAPDSPLFAEAPEPEAFLHDQPSYAAWTPRVHQAPAASSSP
jgi:tRNA threonylcarbamoyladenosine biosynthesis protein TsaB